MPVDLMFLFATAAFAWGLSLATYRWFAVHNSWPMGEWQAHRPGLPIAIGLFAVLFAVLFALARGGASLLIVPLFGFLCALGWTAIMRVGSQASLLLAPAAIVALLLAWIAAAGHVEVEPPRARAILQEDADRPGTTNDRQRLPPVEDRSPLPSRTFAPGPLPKDR